MEQAASLQRNGAKRCGRPNCDYPRWAASFVMPLQIGKTPIVVPRQKKFDEHVNDHQVDFAKAVAERMGTIIPINEITELKNIIENYDKVIAGMPSGLKSNNQIFNQELEKIVNELTNRRKQNG